MDTDTSVVYVLYDDGSTEVQILEGGTGELVLSKPGRFVTEAEYNQALGTLVEQNAEHVATLEEQEQQTLKSDYEALIAAGIPDAVARRLTGYTG